METVVSTLIWAALAQGVLLAGMYLFSKKHRSLANRLLGLFLLTMLYEAAVEFQDFEHILGYGINYYFALPEVKLFYPIFFFHYILEKVGRTKVYWPYLKAHYFLEFLIIGITLLNVILFVFTGKKLEAYFGEPALENLFMVQQYYAFLMVVLGWILAIVEVRRYRSIVRQEYSDMQMLNINWLWRLIFALLPVILLWGAELVRILLGGLYQSEIITVLWGFVILFIYFVSYQAFQHKNLFEGVSKFTAEEPAPAIPKKARPKEYEEDVLPDISPEEKRQLQAIKEHMDLKQPYLEATLSVHQLAEQLGMETRDLSILINHKLNKHFFDFINEYRIEKAMELLRDPQNEKMTVLEVLYEVGFNSKSSFNTVFKKYTGQTPTQYRKAQ